MAWTGTVCTDPPMCYISVRPERHSYGIIRRTGEFVINLTTRGLARAADWCGVRSGRDYDKFREMGLTPGKALAGRRADRRRGAREHRVPRAAGACPWVTHDMFLAEVVAVQVDAAYIDPATGRFCLERACPIVYSHGEYFALGEAHRPLRLVGAEKAAAENAEIRDRNKARDRKEIRTRNKARGRNEISDRNENRIRCRI